MPLAKQQQPLPKVKSSHLQTGSHGEAIACTFLTQKGYQIIERNYRSRFGEIDIIAKRPDGAVSFIEVKSRVGAGHGKPYEAVTFYKKKRLYKTIQFYMLHNKISESTLAFEIVSIEFDLNRNGVSILHFDDVPIT